MLAKENRLKKKKDVENVWKKGKSFRTGLLSLKTLKNNQTAGRFAFAVGTKVSKKAVVRNKLKRRLREITRRRLSHIKPGIDVMLIALPGLENKDFQQTEETTNKLFKKAGITND